MASMLGTKVLKNPDRRATPLIDPSRPRQALGRIGAEGLGQRNPALADLIARLQSGGTPQANAARQEMFNQQQALAASGRPGFGGMAQRLAAQQTTRGNAAVNRMALQEEEARRAALANLILQARQQDIAALGGAVRPPEAGTFDQVLAGTAAATPFILPFLGGGGGAAAAAAGGSSGDEFSDAGPPFETPGGGGGGGGSAGDPTVVRGENTGGDTGDGTSVPGIPDAFLRQSRRPINLSQVLGLQEGRHAGSQELPPRRPSPPPPGPGVLMTPPDGDQARFDRLRHAQQIRRLPPQLIDLLRRR